MDAHATESVGSRHADDIATSEALAGGLVSRRTAQETLEAERAALLEAVEHRAVIEQAKGMLMLKHRCDADTAFGLLLEISRRERRKVRDIAADLVRAGSTPRPLVELTPHNGGSAATTGATADDGGGRRAH